MVEGAEGNLYRPPIGGPPVQSGGGDTAEKGSGTLTAMMIRSVYTLQRARNCAKKNLRTEIYSWEKYLRMRKTFRA